ncbi:unnamed protein product [Auanema sp. JU1783]|nr:unnamed protein product [Auanema sp. JU1783]
MVSCSVLINRIRKSLVLDWVDFASHTSSHGIPRAYESEGIRRKLWLLLFFSCLTCFCFQAYWIIEKFNKNDIIVGVEIKFEQIKFPAVTVCNINPYKNSLARQSSAIKSALESFELAIDRSSHRVPDEDISVRTRRWTNENLVIEPSYVYCTSDENGYYSPSSDDQSMKCICLHYTNENLYWNCEPSNDFSLKKCSNCRFGLCEKSNIGSAPCLCAQNFCVQTIDFQKVYARWPLTIKEQKCPSLFSNSTSNEFCYCVVPENSNTNSYCARRDDWAIAGCHTCDWWGRCQRSYSLHPQDHCICDDELNCFAIQMTSSNYRPRRELAEEEKTKSIVVRQSNKQRIYERILSHYEGLLAVYSRCSCTKSSGCNALKEKDRASNSSTCLCFYNKKNDQIWPCYPEVEWKERKCTKCSTFGDCSFADNQNTAKVDCFCAMPIRMCVRIESPEGNTTDLSDRIVNFWDIQPSTTVSPVQKKKQDREKAYGYAGVTDPIALKTKAMENIIFAVDQLQESEKWAISYNKSDFIVKCSFNGKECHVDTDFHAYLDPTYGACFTYTASKFDNNTNERAGPAYGLRLEVFLNVTEYLPTTEAAGVRLTVHSHEEQPFPDTLGYSAPTGFVSSFGIRLKSMTRKSAPYGDCIEEGKDEDFIYLDKQYSTEGCQRSCIQRHLALSCGCGDPRFPQYRVTKNCPVDDPVKRNCIKEQISYAMRNSKEIGCRCRQPCRQDVYSVSYSASRWPAVPGDQTGCPQGMAPQHCLMYKREQGAMIEVFFEQLNYESLMESEAYGWSNLLSDFGGQLGLWMGVSVITIMELAILICDAVFTVLRCGRRRERKFSGKRSISSLRYSISKPSF